MQRDRARGVCSSDSQFSFGIEAMSQFVVVTHGNEWVVETETKAVGRYADRSHAIAAAIDLADSKGKAGQDAQVLIREAGPTLKTIWTYGKDIYPAAKGKPNNSRSRGTYRMPRTSAQKGRLGDRAQKGIFHRCGCAQCQRQT
jgi:hypothetical protein